MTSLSPIKYIRAGVMRCHTCQSFRLFVRRDGVVIVYFSLNATAAKN